MAQPSPHSNVQQDAQGRRLLSNREGPGGRLTRAFTSCPLRGVAASAAPSFARTREEHVRASLGCEALPTSCRPSRVRTRLPRPCTKPCLFPRPTATRMDGRGRLPPPARVSIGTQTPKHKGFTRKQPHRALFSRKTLTYTGYYCRHGRRRWQLSLEHLPLERGDPTRPAEARVGGRSGDWSQRLHWATERQKQYRTFTGKKHNSCKLNFTLL